ncbi:DNA sulfur modification protein DndB, partial [Bacillus paramycoides]|nr:DNA sulfur modification protein DndB [Bacillus paramycoides]
MTSSNIVETIRAQSPNLGVATNSITVPAIAYMSGGRLWYAATVPYKTLGKFVQTSAVKKKNQEIIQSEIRNRFLDKTHKDDIKNYIEEERAFTIPPVTLVSFEELSFQPFVFDDQKHITSKEEFKNNMETYGSMAGIMFIPIDYEFECLDGNHRTVAIRELAEEN